MIDSALPESETDQPIPSAVAPIGDPSKVRPVAAGTVRTARVATGHRTRAIDTPNGYPVRAAIPERPLERISDVALVPTLQAAAQRHLNRLQTDHLPLAIEPADLRRKVRAARSPNLILFVVDASGSMAARQRMTAVKGAILSLLLDAYQKRDSVGLITFRGTAASLVLPPTNSVSLAQRQLGQLPTGGRTPLAEGLKLTYQLLYQLAQRDKDTLPLIVLLSDGRANVGAGGQPLAEAQAVATQIASRTWSSLVIDCESGYTRLGLAVQLAQTLRGECIRLEALSADRIQQAIYQKLGSGMLTG